MGRRRKTLIISVVLTMLFTVFSSYITIALFDKIVDKGERQSQDPPLSDESEQLIADFQYNDGYDGIASILGHNYGFKDSQEVMFVKAVNLSKHNMFDEPEIHIFNSTNYDININESKNAAYPIKDVSLVGEPVVLIVHTHGTEAYIDDEREYYTVSDTYRSSDIEKNVVAVGAVMAKRLNELGIPTLHDVRMHDLESYSRSYSASYQAVKEYLNKFPSIKYVIDVHRDSIFTAQNENQKPVTIINGEKTAQVMLVVGTNQNGGHPNWRENLTVALNLQEKFNNYPTLCRPVYIRTSNFNQQLLSGMMLLEVGSCGNTLAEAKRGASIAADCLAKMIREN